MKVVMINDCAYVGETILKHIPKNIQRNHIKRDRKGIWNKTVRLTYRILKAQGDLFHVHYLLQDCYLALKLGKKPIVGHAHGSDLRTSIKHRFWGKIVKHNLRECNKILVSTPDIFTTAKKFNQNTDYLPNPVDTSIFYTKPLRKKGRRKRVLIAGSSDWNTKGTDLIIQALSSIGKNFKIFIITYGKDYEKTISLARSLGLEIRSLPRTSHMNVREYYWNVDLVVGGIGAGSLGMVVLEAIACGRPVITYVSSQYEEYQDFPLKDVNTAERIAIAIQESSQELWNAEYEYFCKYHSPKIVINRIKHLYRDLSKS